jgi:hypothetical protein
MLLQQLGNTAPGKCIFAEVLAEKLSTASLETVNQLKGSVAEARGQFGKPHEAEYPPLEAVARKLVKTATQDCVCMCVCDIDLESIVTSYILICIVN